MQNETKVYLQNSDGDKRSETPFSYRRHIQEIAAQWIIAEDVFDRTNQVNPTNCMCKDLVVAES